MKVKFELEISDDVAQTLLNSKNSTIPFEINSIFENKLALLESYAINNNVNKIFGLVCFGLKTGEINLKIIE